MRYIKGEGGKFAGSIGDGRDTVPTPAQTLRDLADRVDAGEDVPGLAAALQALRQGDRAPRTFGCVHCGADGTGVDLGCTPRVEGDRLVAFHRWSIPAQTHDAEPEDWVPACPQCRATQLTAVNTDVTECLRCKAAFTAEECVPTFEQPVDARFFVSDWTPSVEDYCPGPDGHMYRVTVFRDRAQDRDTGVLLPADTAWKVEITRTVSTDPQDRTCTVPVHATVYIGTDADARVWNDVEDCTASLGLHPRFH